MKITAVIMAGGRGERFWPKSRNDNPKQFLSLTKDGETMIQKTVNRLRPLVAPEDVYIVTNAAYKELVFDQLPSIPKGNVLLEPCARNTAPCIAFAASVINRKYEDAIMLVLPSDHLIGYEDIYINTLKKAIKAAESGKRLVTIGITPEYPETGYGYINFGQAKEDVYAVERFVEKPDLPTAKEYLASGKYLWNSGMFVWKISSVMLNIKTFMPDIYEGAVRIGQAFGTPGFNEVLVKEFTAFRSESIDFGIMEKAKHIYTIPGSFGWDDVGSWLAVGRINPANDAGNVVRGDVVAVNSTRCIVEGGSKTIAMVGLEDTIIVDTKDALLVCAKESAGDIRKVLEMLKAENRTELL